MHQLGHVLTNQQWRKTSSFKEKNKILSYDQQKYYFAMEKKCVNLLKEHSDIGNKKDFLFLYTTYKNQGFIQYVT